MKFDFKFLKKFFKNKKVLITGHTGFKGSWLSLILYEFGAQIYGLSLNDSSHKNLKIFGIEKKIKNFYGDVSNKNLFYKTVKNVKPQIIFHLAAQSLVRESYSNPEKTFYTNTMGVLNLMEICKIQKGIKSLIIVTSDKCYKNKELKSGYEESDELGGDDPYSASKASAELIFNCYKKSYSKFSFGKNSVRAGNVIGGGDWSKDRIIPDVIKFIKNKKIIYIRSPNSVRPWQHVLEPLSGYIKLAILAFMSPKKYCSSWNFGPIKNPKYSVLKVVNLFLLNMKKNNKIIIKKNSKFKETKMLQLKCNKAKKIMFWQPKWNIKKSIKETASWYEAYLKNENMKQFSLKQIQDYFSNKI